MISPGGRPIDESPLSASKTSNWVARVGGLPPYIRGVARGIAKKHGGKVTSRDIATAIAAMKRFIADPHTKPAVKAAAAAALAEWEGKRAAAHALSNPGARDVELAATAGHHIKGTVTINNALRHHQKEGEPVHPTVAAIDKAFEKAGSAKDILGTAGHLHRGFSVQALAGLQPGDSFVDKGFVSTSRRHSVSNGFGGGVTRLHIESAHPSLKAIDVYGISQHPNEAEVLLPRNTKFTVKRRVEHGGHSHLYVHAEPAVAVASKVGKKAAA